jgi:hypothetical protein
MGSPSRVDSSLMRNPWDRLTIGYAPYRGYLVSTVSAGESGASAHARGSRGRRPLGARMPPYRCSAALLTWRPARAAATRTTS